MHVLFEKNNIKTYVDLIRSHLWWAVALSGEWPETANKYCCCCCCILSTLVL